MILIQKSYVLKKNFSSYKTNWCYPLLYTENLNFKKKKTQVKSSINDKNTYLVKNYS